MDKELLEILACPVCKLGIEFRESTGDLKCPDCGRVYPIRNGIPIMLVDEAIVETAADSGKPAPKNVSGAGGSSSLG